MQQVLVVVGRVVGRVRQTDAQDLLEYGLLAALIAFVAYVAVGQLGATINTVFWQPIAQTF
jgi:hypothetical protein